MSKKKIKDKVIWYTQGWGWLGFRAQIGMLIVRSLYRLHIIGEETVKEYVEIIKNAAFAKIAKDKNLNVKKIKNKER